jgi:hypothetical protein
VPEAMDGTQWTDTAPGENGTQVDASVLLDNFFSEEADMASVAVQNGWRWCEKCGAMYFPGPANACAGGGQHAPGPSFDYAATYTAT